jgi:hypothetical protein
LFNPFIKRYKISQERLEICRTCDSFNHTTTQCKECGCFMDYKTLLPYVSCPLDKWKEFEDKEDK